MSTTERDRIEELEEFHHRLELYRTHNLHSLQNLAPDICTCHRCEGFRSLSARLEGEEVGEIEGILSECLNPPLILSDDNAVVVAEWFTERIEKALALVRRREG